MKKAVKEILIYAALILLFSAAAAAFAIDADLTARPVVITYSAGKTLQISLAFAFRSVLAAFAVCTAYCATIIILFRKNENRVKVGKKYGIYFGVLAILGVMAFAAIATLLSAFGFGGVAALFTGSLITLIYFTVIYGLYFEDKINSNEIVWEIVRFAIVGVIAAAFDFSAAYAVQFFAFKGVGWWFVTPAATACGFAVGVTINYFLSTYLVYKNAKSGLSKRAKGVVLFVALSAVGLFIGIGLQYFLYDLLFIKYSVSAFTYPVDFVIRTLVVMIYNYVSRKLIIYK